MADNIQFQPFNDTGVFDRLVMNVQSQQGLTGKNMRAPQIIVGVRRREPIQVRPANRGEQQRIRLGSNDAVKPWVNGHKVRWQVAMAISSLKLPDGMRTS